jgi:hypothetical protein
MGKVDCFNLAGIYCWFYSQEHRPPHFHAKRKGQWEVRVFFQMGRTNMIQWKKGPASRIDRRDLDTLCEVAELHRAELLGEWEEKVCCDG